MSKQQTTVTRPASTHSMGLAIFRAPRFDRLYHDYIILGKEGIVVE